MDLLKILENLASLNLSDTQAGWVEPQKIQGLKNSICAALKLPAQNWNEGYAIREHAFKLSFQDQAKIQTILNSEAVKNKLHTIYTADQLKGFEGFKERGQFGLAAIDALETVHAWIVEREKHFDPKIAPVVVRPREFRGRRQVLASALQLTRAPTFEQLEVLPFVAKLIDRLSQRPIITTALWNILGDRPPVQQAPAPVRVTVTTRAPVMPVSPAILRSRSAYAASPYRYTTAPLEFNDHKPKSPKRHKP